MGACRTIGGSYGVYVVDTLAYVSSYDRGLRIINVSNKWNPYQVGYCDTPGKAYDVYVSGSYAYVADGSAGLQIYENLLIGIEEEYGILNVISSIIMRNSSFIFEITYPMKLSLSLSDIAGRQVKKNEGYFIKGRNKINFDGIKAGIYFYRIKYGGKEKKGKLVIL